MIYPELNNYSHVFQLDGEIWKDFAEAPQRYMVSSYGRVMIKAYHGVGRNQHSEFAIYHPSKIMRTNPDSRGHPQLHLYFINRTARVHRLVAETFLPAPSNELLEECRKANYDVVLINHKDEVKGNAHVSNLEWCTPSYNQREYSHNRVGVLEYSGSNSVRSKLTEDDVDEILRLREDTKLSQREIGEMFGVKQITISNILTGRSWSHYTGLDRVKGYYGKRVPKSKYLKD